MKDIILTTSTRQSLVEEISIEVLTGIESLLDKRHQPPSHTEYLTGKEVESILKISTQTRYEWGHRGILRPYKIGSRTRYKRDEVHNALIALESKNV